MWVAGLKKTSCCHPVENPSHSGYALQIIVFCGSSTPKQYIGLRNHYGTKNFSAENGLQMAITSLLKDIRTSPFGTLIQGPFSQSSTSVELSESPMSDCAFLQMDNTSLQLMRAELDYGK